MLQFTRSGLMRPIRLGQEIGRGGEGVVFTVEGQKDRVAKIYSSPPDRRKAQKLAAMAEAANPSLLKIAAWPDTLLRDNEGGLHGFTMPRAFSHQDIHELYTPKSRLKAFPKADFRFLVHVAANVARAFAVVHEQGHVVGDVNHGNLLVEPMGTVKFIDCDSFRIGNGANAFTCDVGVPLFTAPELQARAFRGIERTASHDLFGLAVLLFHLLYLGRHPFAGRYSGPGDIPIEKAIGECRFAYGPNDAAKGMARPPRTIPLETMGGAIAQLFILSFGYAGRNGTRPDAKTWVEALEKLEASLRACSLESSHYFPGDLSACPWCMVELQIDACLFGQRIVAGRAIRPISLGRLKNKISEVPDPGAAPPLPSDWPWRPPSGVETPSGNLKIFHEALGISGGVGSAGLAVQELAYRVPTEDVGIVVVTLVFCGFAYAIWPRVLAAEKRGEADKALSAAETQWESVLARWKGEAVRDAFAAKRKSLEDALADISESMRRRREHERNFQFNRSEPVDWRETDAIDREIEARIQKLLSILPRELAQLQRLGQGINAARKRLMPVLKKTWNTLKTEEARRNALR